MTSRRLKEDESASRDSTLRFAESEDISASGMMNGEDCLGTFFDALLALNDDLCADEEFVGNISIETIKLIQIITSRT